MQGFWLKLSAYLVTPLTWIVFTFGAIIGSFLNVCIFRIPEGTFFKEQRSVCRSCGARIPAYLNVPILSWVVLRGRTACCKAPLSIQYPLVELATALLMVVVYWSYPFVSVRGAAIEYDYANMIRAIHAAVFVAALLVCSVIDLRHMIIPDVISLPMIALTPVVVWLHPDLDWQSAAIGVAAGGLSLYAIAWIYWLVRHEVGMGMGDVKLLAGIGGWLGYQAIIPTVFYASILGAAFGLGAVALSRERSMKTAIPFGPFLALGAIIHLFAGSYLQELLLAK
jgi:leader peptidase (prepilin peptidase)/N-methyltransferase